MSQHFLISRTDNIGDVIFTLPIAYFLKKEFPDSKVSILAKNYVKDIVLAYSYIDEFISYKDLLNKNETEQISTIKKLNIETVFIVFPNNKLAKIFYKSDIKNRVGTNRRLSHWLYCNHKINLKRKNSTLHEAQLNLKLLSCLNIKNKFKLPDIIPAVKLKPQTTNIFINLVAAKKFNLIIHPGSNGSSIDWSISQYSALIDSLDKNKFEIFITGTREERDLFKELLANKNNNVHDMFGKFSLGDFLGFISDVDGLVAGSTGPLHMASSIGINTLGIYPNKEGLSPKKLGPIGKKANYITTPKKCTCRNKKNCECMLNIKVEDVKKTINSWTA